MGLVMICVYVWSGWCVDVGVKSLQIEKFESIENVVVEEGRRS